MHKHEYTYRCTARCPIGKRCFVIKVPMLIKEPMAVLQKCTAIKGDIEITIGGPRPP